MKRLIAAAACFAVLLAPTIYVSAQPTEPETIETDATGPEAQALWPGRSQAIRDLAQAVRNLDQKVEGLGDKIQNMSEGVIVTYKDQREPVIGHVEITQALCRDENVLNNPNSTPLNFPGEVHRQTFGWACKSQRSKEICRLHGYDVAGLAIPSRSGMPKSGNYVPVMGSTIPCVGVQAM